MMVAAHRMVIITMTMVLQHRGGRRGAGRGAERGGQSLDSCSHHAIMVAFCLGIYQTKT
jgi:hypothetical protein